LPRDPPLRLDFGNVVEVRRLLVAVRLATDEMDWVLDDRLRRRAQRELGIREAKRRLGDVRGQLAFLFQFADIDIEDGDGDEDEGGPPVQ